MADWSNLPAELLLMIALRLLSVVDLLRFRTICSSFRSSVPLVADNPFPSRPLLHLNPLVVTIDTPPDGQELIYGLDRSAFLSRATFFRVSSSSSRRGWLIKCDGDRTSYGKLLLLNPLSRLPMCPLCVSIDLLRVSEIQAAHIVQIQHKEQKEEVFGFKRLVLAANGRLLGVGCDGVIRFWNGEVWTKIKNQGSRFCDIIVEREGGLAYALDSHGTGWWVSSSRGMFRFGPSLDAYATKECCRDLVLVQCRGEFYIVDRLTKEDLSNRKEFANWGAHRSITIQDNDGTEKWETPVQYYHHKTLGFSVYKVNEAVGKWEQVMSLGDNAFVMASDACFSVLAHEFDGCLKNSIYFSEEDYPATLKVFKLEDGSITTMTEDVQSCFQMFVPTFN